MLALFECKNAQLVFDSAFLHPVCSNIHLCVTLHYFHVIWEIFEFAFDLNRQIKIISMLARVNIVIDNQSGLFMYCIHFVCEFVYKCVYQL